MTTKLTLSINEKTIERAKLVSRKRGKSLSKIVEEYLDSISEKETKKMSGVKKLSGILKNKVPADIDWKKIKAEHLSKKHGI